MSLKTDYFNGETGLTQTLNNAFNAGVAFVGSGLTEISVLSLGDRNGSNMGAGSATPGIYFDLDGPSMGYRMWISVSGEIAPSGAGRTLVQVPIASGDSSMASATDIANVVSAISGAPFVVTQIGNSLQFETAAPKTVSTHITLSSGWGSASGTVVQNGQDPVGNYSTIRASLLSAAAAGQTQFTIVLPTTYQPSALRGSFMSNCGSNGNSNSLIANNSYLQGNTPSGYQSYQQRGSSTTNANTGTGGNSPNLLLQAYLAGIQDGMAAQQIYDYEVTVQLNVSDTITTSINMIFNFQTT